MKYEVYTVLLGAIDKDFNQKDYTENDDDIQALENLYNSAKNNKNSVTGSFEIQQLHNTYKVNYTANTRTLKQISKDFNHNQTEIKNFFKIKNLIHELQNEYSKTFDFEERSQ